MKRKTIFIFVVFAIFSVNIATAGNLSIVLQPSSEQIKPDDEFTVQVNVKDVSNLFAVSLELQYNAALLKVTDVSIGDFMGADVISFNMPGDGSTSIAVSKKAGSDSASGSGTLSTVKFKAVKEGIATISVKTDTLTLKQSDDKPVPGFGGLQVVPCKIAIGSGQVMQPTVSVEPTETQAKPGDEITLKATISNVENLFGASFEMQYDGNILEYVDAKAGDFMGKDVIFFNLKGDKGVSIAISMKSGATPAKGSGTIAILTFKAKTEGEFQISYRSKTLNLQRSDGTSMSATIKNGIVKIIQATIIKGDVNGDNQVRANDAILALRISAGLMEATPEQIKAADMNDDGKVKSNDAIMILRKSAGLLSPDRKIIVPKTSNVMITLGNTYGIAGDSISVPLVIDKPNIIAGGDITICYDSSVLKAIGVSSDDRVLLASNLTENGVVYITFASINNLSSKTLVKVQFDIIADKISPLILRTADLYQSDAIPINVMKQDSKFVSWTIAPGCSALLQNFPNPFNPETWIPYQLHESSEVAIRIYDIAGELIHELKLEYRPAGVYVSQDRAAYWDGKNESGEQVASGVYFYTIQAGKYTAARKMLMMK